MGIHLSVTQSWQGGWSVAEFLSGTIPGGGGLISALSKRGPVLGCKAGQAGRAGWVIQVGVLNDAPDETDRYVTRNKMAVQANFIEAPATDYRIEVCVIVAPAAKVL